jgi:hypothetical protein
MSFRGLAVKRTISPLHGARIASRGSTRIIPRGISLGLVTVPAVFRTRMAGHAFGLALAGGFRRWSPEAALNLWPLLPVRMPVRLLVPVKASWYVGRIICPFDGLSSGQEHLEQKNQEPSQRGFRTVGETGLEPATSAMSKQCSNQLSYPPKKDHIIPTAAAFDNDASGSLGLATLLQARCPLWLPSFRHTIPPSH